jgi:hypothetical protein
VGKFIVQELLKTGKHKVTAITRVDSKNTIPEGAVVAKVDYESTASLVEALKGQDLLLITMSVFAPPEAQLKLITAAKEAGVQWIIPNGFGADHTDEPLSSESLLGAGQKVVREAIEAAGLDWIGIACGFWYEYSLSGGAPRYGFDFPNKTLVYYDEGETKMATSTWEQVGRTVAALLSLKVLKDDENDKSHVVDDWRDRYVITYSFNVTQKEMFESVLKVTGDKASDWKISKTPVVPHYQESVKKLKETGNRLYFAQALYSRGFFPDANQVDKFGADNEILGLPKEDFDARTKIAVEMDRDGYHKQ